MEEFAVYISSVVVGLFIGFVAGMIIGIILVLFRYEKLKK